MTAAPLMLRYEGDGQFVPLGTYWMRKGDEEYVVGQVYRMGVHDERSMASHRHYFAQLKELWLTLPDALLPIYPSVEHLRKKMLITAGFCHERQVVFESERDARIAAAVIKPIDEYAIVAVEGCVVTHWTAKSQAESAMGKEDFQASKDAVFHEIDKLLNMPKGTSQKQAGRAA